MRVFQRVFSANDLSYFTPEPQHAAGQLILIFGSTALLSDSANFFAIRSAFPDALIVGCSTAVEIHGSMVSEETLVMTVVAFERTRVKLATLDITGFYSYGEISPHIPGAACELHNQTMTITTFSES